MGHTFNLAHSWQKSLGVPWIPLADEPAALSFMNYPFLAAAGGTVTFFSKFMFRFSDQELLYMRHAPPRLVEQGNALWFDNHGFRRAAICVEPRFSLSVQCTHANGVLEFMEPPVVQLTLKNITNQPQLVDEHVLSGGDNTTLIIKRKRSPARELTGYTRRCYQPNNIVPKPGESVTDSLFLVGRNGWDMSEPGDYNIQASISLGGEDIVSTPVHIRVSTPKSREEESVAQDYFSDDVGRVLNFDGSRFLSTANNTLREVVDQLPQSKAAIHAGVALASPLASETKELAHDGRAFQTKVSKPDVKEVRRLLKAMVDDPKLCAATLGSIDYEYYANRFRAILEESKKAKAATSR